MIVIHILQYGRALCAEAAKTFVKDWPKEWKWLSVANAYSDDSTLEHRCAECYRLLEADPVLAAAAQPEKPDASA